MKIRCIDVRKVTGNSSRILSEEKITGELEFVPLPDGSGLLMMPIDTLISNNRGLREIDPLSKLDKHHRTVLTLTKKECGQLLTSNRSEFTVARKGWGRFWKHKFNICAD